MLFKKPTTTHQSTMPFLVWRYLALNRMLKWWLSSHPKHSFPQQPFQCCSLPREGIISYDTQDLKIPALHIVQTLGTLLSEKNLRWYWISLEKRKWADHCYSCFVQEELDRSTLQALLSGSPPPLSQGFNSTSSRLLHGTDFKAVYRTLKFFRTRKDHSSILSTLEEENTSKHRGTGVNQT